MKTPTVGILGFQGDVIEHLEATKKAAANLKLRLNTPVVRTREELRGIDALIIPGGESTTLQALSEREGMFNGMKKVPNIFGTCAGAILLANNVSHKTQGQKTLGLMNITVDRNAYGRQIESFEETITTNFGTMHAVFIRAPQILRIGRGVTVLAKRGAEVLACEEGQRGTFYMAACFHPELTMTLFHEYFLKRAFHI